MGTRSAASFAFSLVPEDPPEADGSRRGVWEEELRPLMEHPGVWYRVRGARSREAARTIAGSLTRKETKRPDGAWSFRGGISKADGNAYIWARYDGEGGEKPAGRRRAPGPARRTTFRQWLVQQNERKDAVGELARFAIKDGGWPRRGPITRETFARYLDKKGSPVAQWFPPAWREFEATGNGA
jgi:hypothetical protein